MYTFHKKFYIFYSVLYARNLLHFILNARNAPKKSMLIEKWTEPGITYLNIIQIHKNTNLLYW